LTGIKIRELENRIKDAKDKESIEEIASEIKCTMCGKTFDWTDLCLGDNLYDIFVGYGSKHDGERMQFSFCCDCFDKVVDWVIPQCSIDPIVDSDYLDHCIGADNHIHEDWGPGGGEQNKVKTRVIVCGGRDFNDYEYMSKVLDKYLQGINKMEIVSGHAKGADTLGEKYAEAHNILCPVFPADWENNGRIAGFIRNSKMIDYVMEEKPLVIAFWDGKSHGTKDTLKKAFIKNIPCIIAGYGDYDINELIEKVRPEYYKVYAAYAIGYYDGFHKIPVSNSVNEKSSAYYALGYREAQGSIDERRIHELGNKTVSELILESAKDLMLDNMPKFVWYSTDWEDED